MCSSAATAAAMFFFFCRRWFFSVDGVEDCIHRYILLTLGREVESSTDRLLDGASPEVALERACRMGAFVATKQGATPFHDPDGINALVEK